MISQKIHDELSVLANKQRFTTTDAKDLQEKIKAYIDPTYSVCLRCAQQLKHGQKMIKNYLSSVQIIEEFLKTVPPVVEETVLEMEELPEPDVDIVEAEKVGCTKCSRKRKNKS